MSKRAGQFVRRERDFYPTPEKAVLPLLPHLPRGATFYEPCAGDGALINHLVKHGMICAGGSDICPQRADIRRADALSLNDFGCADLIIVNPPWTREILHPMILHFQRIAPTWLLFDAGWMSTKQSAPFLDQCSHIVAVGRLCWIPGTTMTGKDDCAWYRFHAQHSGGPRFIGHPVKEAA